MTCPLAVEYYHTAGNQGQAKDLPGLQKGICMSLPYAMIFDSTGKSFGCFPVLCVALNSSVNITVFTFFVLPV